MPGILWVKTKISVSYYKSQYHRRLSVGRVFPGCIQCALTHVSNPRLPHSFPYSDVLLLSGLDHTLRST